MIWRTAHAAIALIWGQRSASLQMMLEEGGSAASPQKRARMSSMPMLLDRCFSMMANLGKDLLPQCLAVRCEVLVGAGEGPVCGLQRSPGNDGGVGTAGL